MNGKRVYFLIHLWRWIWNEYESLQAAERKRYTYVCVCANYIIYWRNPIEKATFCCWICILFTFVMDFVISFRCFWKLLDVIFLADLGSILELFGTNFGSFWKLLEAIFAPLGPPGAPLSPWAPQEPIFSQFWPSWDPLGEPPGPFRSGFWANLASTWTNLEPTWAQLGANLRHLGAILGPIWAQNGSIKPTWRDLEAI